jgi:imidazolonepropionase-like amidohydrolase
MNMLTQVETSHEKSFLRNVRILDVKNGLLGEVTNVLAADGIIMDVGIREKPRDSDAIECDGGTLMPGLIDCHAHILSPFLSEQKGFLGAWTFRQIRNNLENTLASGIVCVRDMLSTIKIMNGIRRKIASGKVLGPTILAAGPVLSCKGGYPEFINPLLFPLSAIIGQPKLNLSTPSKAASMVRYLKKCGADHIKVGFTSYTRAYQAHERMPAVTDYVFDAICKTAHEADLVVSVHHNWSEDLVRILRHDIDSLEHLVYDREINDNEIALIKNKKITVVPTLTVSDGMARFEEKLGFLESGRAKEMFEKIPLQHLIWISKTWLDFKGERYDKAFGFWRANRKNYAGVERTARKLYEAGVPMLAGTDLGAVVAFPGELADEIMRLHHIGMTKLEAIQSATIRAAEFLGLDHKLGSVEIAKNSDIILVDGNPLDDLKALRRIRLVGKGGRWFRPEHSELPDFWPGYSVTFQG